MERDPQPEPWDTEGALTVDQPDGFETPESAAMYGFPAKYCCVITSRLEGDRAYVLLNTGSKDDPYLYGVNCKRQEGRWFETGSANMPGWEQTHHNPDVGTLSVWGEAPADADSVRVTFDGKTVEEVVIGGAYLFVWWRVPSGIWPRLAAFRRAGHWVQA